MRRGFGLVEILVALALFAALLLPVLALVRSGTGTTVAHDFRVLALGRANILLEGLRVADHDELVRSITPGQDTGPAESHPLAARLRDAALAVAGGAQAPPALTSRLAFYQERVAVRRAGATADGGLLELEVEIRWRTPLDGQAQVRSVALRTLVARPDVTEAR